MCRAVLLFCAVNVMCGAVFADESLLLNLPPDESFARYLVQLKIPGRDEAMTWTARSVGRLEVAGTPCRWIEMVSTESRGAVIYKCLIPEAEIGPDKNPFAATKRVLARLPNQPSREATSLEQENAILFHILTGPSKEIKKLKEKEKVGWQKGSLDCDVVTGTAEHDLSGTKLAIHFRILRESTVPFSLAGADFELLAGESEIKVQVTMRLDDFGTGAKSEITDIP